MRTIYLKTNRQYINTYFYFYKVVEKSEDETITITVTKDAIETETNEDFFDQVSFIKNVLCKDEGCEEITRQEFDDFLKETSTNINQLTAI